MCCLTCTFFNPTEPDAHRIARESGQCEKRCGGKWDWPTVFRYVGAHDEPLHGMCLLNPEPKRVASWHACAQHRLMYDANGWGVKAFKAGSDTLIAWARQQYLHVKGGCKDWQTERLEYLEEQNTAMRKQLAAVRKISASRLARLQKTEPPKKRVPKPAPLIINPVVQKEPVLAQFKSRSDMVWESWIEAARKAGAIAVPRV